MNTVAFGFDEVFNLNPGGVPTLKRALIVAEIPFTPGMRWQRGFKFAGCDIANHIGQPVVVIDNGDHLQFLGFADLDEKNSDWAKGWLVIKESDSTFLGFYPTEYLATKSLQEAGEGFVLRYGSKRFGDNNEFNISEYENAA